MLRLGPLLLVVIVIEGVRLWYNGGNIRPYAIEILKGVVWPSLPNGGWSITVEAHFYVILPFLLIIAEKRPSALIGFVLAAISIRLAIYLSGLDIQQFAYGTIVERIDQFVFGIIAFKYKRVFKGNHGLAISVMAIFFAIYYIFDLQGGGKDGSKMWWILLPTIEGIAYCTLIAWYDNSFSHSLGPVSRLIGKMGEYSYSIYLIHFFFVFQMAQFIAAHVMALDNFYVAMAWSALSFMLMMPIGYISMKLIEEPPRRFRKKYVV